MRPQATPPVWQTGERDAALSAPRNLVHRWEGPGELKSPLSHMQLCSRSADWFFPQWSRLPSRYQTSLFGAPTMCLVDSMHLCKSPKQVFGKVWHIFSGSSINWDIVPSRSSLLWGQEGIFGQLSHKCPFYSPGTYTVFSCHASLISSNLGHFVNLSELDTGRVLAIILQNIPQPGFVWCLLMIRLRLWMLCLSQDVISGGRWC